MNRRLVSLLLSIIKFLLFLVTLVLLFGYLFTFYKEHVVSLATPPEVLSVTPPDVETLTYQTWGDKKNRPIVLLHGTGANSFIWKNVGPILAEENYYVVAIDIQPFGWSKIPKDQDYKKESQAKRLVSALQSLDVKDPTIVGHSFSSKVAIQLGLFMPIKKLILVAPVLDYETTKTPLIVNLVKVSFIRDPLLSLFVNNPLLAEKLLYSFMYKKDVDILEITKLTTLPFNKEGVNHAYGEWFQEFFIPSSVVSDSDSLKKIPAPVEVLWGDKDTVISEDKFFELQQVRPDAKKVTLEDVGHMPHLEDLGLFIKSLLDLLR